MARSTKPRRADFYPDDWLAGTLELTLEEEGAYIRICALIYSKGQPIPDNDRWLAGMCRVSTRKWRVLRRALIDKNKITITDGLIHQQRCEFELGRAAERSQKQAENVAKRWRKLAESELSGNREIDEPATKPLNNNESAGTTVDKNGIPTTNHQPPTTNTKDSLSVDFENFWELYPSRKPHSNPKKTARQKFELARSSGASAADIIRGAGHYAMYVERERVEPRYVAQAATWLGQERWAEYQEPPPDPRPVDDGYL